MPVWMHRIWRTYLRCIKSTRHAMDVIQGDVDLPPLPVGEGMGEGLRKS